MKKYLKKMSERSLKLARNVMIMICVAMVMTALSIYDGPILAVIAILFTVGGFCWITAVVDFESQEVRTKKVKEKKNGK